MKRTPEQWLELAMRRERDRLLAGSVRLCRADMPPPVDIDALKRRAIADRALMIHTK